MCKALLPLRLLNKADAWQFGAKRNIFYAPCSKTFPRDCPKMGYFELKSSKVASLWGLRPQTASLKRLGGFAPRLPLPQGAPLPDSPTKSYESASAVMNASDSSGWLLSLDHAYFYYQETGLPFL